VIGLLQGLLIALDMGCALAVYILFCKPDFVVGLLAWGWLPSRWDDATPLDEDQVALLRGAVGRLRGPALLALAAISFGCGALISWLRLA
jgi:protein-S-isoprenylcysteine O-methyltransferase Ste14